MIALISLVVNRREAGTVLTAHPIRGTLYIGYLCIRGIGGGDMELQQIRKGSTRTLVLSLLTEAPMYGYQIARELERRSEGYFQVSEGLLYPTLHQMEREGLLSSEWQTPVGKRRRKVYAITPVGRRQLGDSVAQWHSFIERFVGFVQGFGVWPQGEL